MQPQPAVAALQCLPRVACGNNAKGATTRRRPPTPRRYHCAQPCIGTAQCHRLRCKTKRRRPPPQQHVNAHRPHVALLALHQHNPPRRAVDPGQLQPPRDRVAIYPRAWQRSNVLGHQGTVDTSTSRALICCRDANAPAAEPLRERTLCTHDNEAPATDKVLPLVEGSRAAALNNGVARDALTLDGIASLAPDVEEAAPAPAETLSCRQNVADALIGMTALGICVRLHEPIKSSEHATQGCATR